MERRYQARLDELLGDAEVRPGLLRGLLPRLEAFLEPFVRFLCCCEQRTNAHHYVSGCCVRKPGGGKIQTPALSVPVLRVMIAGVIERALKAHSHERIRRNANRRLRRNEEARLYHWRRRKRLPPRRFDQRT